MKLRSIVLGTVCVGCCIIAWAYLRQPTTNPTTTLLSLRVGQPFSEVVGESTHPLVVGPGNPEKWADGNGWTYVDKPAVVIKFNDPRHGFILPPTKFAAIGYEHGKVATISTSPMLRKLPFDQAVAVLENLQNQFRAGGWEPWKDDGSVWFDLTPEGRKRLYSRMFEPGFSQESTLRVPNKYGMTFRLKCAEGCWARKSPYLFLIDVGISEDIEGWEPGLPEGQKK